MWGHTSVRPGGHLADVGQQAPAEVVSVLELPWAGLRTALTIADRRRPPVCLAVQRDWAALPPQSDRSPALAPGLERQRAGPAAPCPQPPPPTRTGDLITVAFSGLS